MKLVTVLMLVAFPLYCYAGSGCQLLEDVVEKTITAELSPAEYVEAVQEFIPDEATEKAAIQLKQCYLKQSNETLNDFRTMMNSMYNSAYCALF
ncbi:mammaglobin-A-like [Equus przewalskii]|nr:mammaglobin-A [Equus caballus]XP_008509911.1 PREDICTED: mammaglobin-A-like [Equus przewalskii]